MKRSDLTIAIKCESIEKVATRLHERFALVFTPRASSFLGGEYYIAKADHEEVIVQFNRDGEEIAEEDFDGYGVLVQVNSCCNSDRWHRLIDDVDGVLVRENEYDV